ncbi:MAG: FAD-dependent oxidoreductase [Chromatiales bacterium]|nr:MAG: FAD-dependent oxidoreductase [Chromatiales bacterium]
MHVVVLGAGVVGVTTAYYLSRHGCDVTVVDRASDVGDGASFANAGQLSYSFTDSLAKPEFLTHIPALMLGRDEGVQVRLTPALVTWGTRFVGQCTRKHARENTLAVLKIAMRSAELLAQIRDALPFDFWHRKAGKLVLLSSQAELDAARNTLELKRSHGCDTRILSRAEAMAVEPALEQVSEDIAGAVYSKSDEVADSQKFTAGLKDWLEATGTVKFRLSSDASKLIARNGRTHAVVVDEEPLEADAFVVCMGAWSHELLRTVGINPHVFPVRGYSITLPPGEAAPSVSMTALRHRMVYSRLNGHVRIAGFADFRGFDTSTDNERTQLLLDLARRYAPHAADYDADDIKPWGGFRPMTPNGQPRVGQTRSKGLFVNTGHGMLGWTLACATSFDAARAVAEAH